METSWHPLGPEKPVEKPARQEHDSLRPIRDILGPKEAEYAQFAGNVDLTDEDVLGLLSGEITERDIKDRRDAIVHEQRVAKVMTAYADVPTMRLLDRYRNYGGGWDSHYSDEYERLEIEREALKRLLDTREHIPRHHRGPGKIRRQTLAKANRSKNKSKNR